MEYHGLYLWKHNQDKLVYLGYNWSGTGYWYQFARVDQPNRVWCDVTDADLNLLEKIPDEEAA